MDILISLFLVPNFSLKIGIMIMSAMFLGAALSFNWKDLRKLIFIILIFVVYQMWIHDTILDTTIIVSSLSHVQESLANILISLFLVVVYCSGLVGGMYIVYMTKKPEENRRKELEKKLQDIQDRGKETEDKNKKTGGL
jgi:glucan phosphoethanolaminetransferase (alkaline phosphatase superfamily)